MAEVSTYGDEYGGRRVPRRGGVWILSKPDALREAAVVADRPWGFVVRRVCLRSHPLRAPWRAAQPSDSTKARSSHTSPAADVAAHLRHTPVRVAHARRLEVTSSVLAVGAPLQRPA